MLYKVLSRCFKKILKDSRRKNENAHFRTRRFALIYRETTWWNSRKK